jgi:hypothetical protein
MPFVGQWSLHCMSIQLHYEYPIKKVHYAKKSLLHFLVAKNENSWPRFSLYGKTSQCTVEKLKWKDVIEIELMEQIYLLRLALCKNDSSITHISMWILVGSPRVNQTLLLWPPSAYCDRRQLTVTAVSLLWPPSAYCDRRQLTVRFPGETFRTDSTLWQHFVIFMYVFGDRSHKCIFGRSSVAYTP